MRPTPSVLFVNQHYHPDVASTGQHLTDLAEHLSARGFRVGVLCARGRYGSGQVRAPGREERNEVSIRRLPVTRFGRGSHAGRLLDYATFFLQAVTCLVAGRQYDCVVFLTTPPLLPVAGILLRWLRGGRYGIWCMDLHPEAELALGMLRDGGPLARLLQALDRAAFRRAHFVVALGECMKRRVLAKGVPEERVETIPVWSRAEEVAPLERSENPLARELAVDGKFVVMYSGNAGLAHRFEEILDAMGQLDEEDGFFFLFVGGGPRKQEIVSLAQSRGIENFSYLDYFPREQIRYSLPVADVHLICMRPEMSGIVVPGKLYGAMAAGRPVLFIGPPESDVARTIVDAGCGEVIDPGGKYAAERLRECLLTLRRDPARARALGASGRREFLRRYERGVTCERWRELLDAKAVPARKGGRSEAMLARSGS